MWQRIAREAEKPGVSQLRSWLSSQIASWPAVRESSEKERKTAVKEESREQLSSRRSLERHSRARRKPAKSYRAWKQRSREEETYL